MMRAHRLLTVVLVSAGLVGCTSSRPDAYVRGHDDAIATLPLKDRIQIYQEAIGGAFQVGDPSLYLLLDPRLLPREGGYGDGPAVSQATRNELLKSHIVQGVCQPTGGGAKVAHCEASLAGYVIRLSDVFQAAHDTMVVNLYVQRYSTPSSAGVGHLRFERIYKLVKHGATWDAVAEGRVELGGQ